MKNLILTICLSVAVSFSFAQIDVVGPEGKVGIGNIPDPTESLDVKGNAKVRGANLMLGAEAGSTYARAQVGLGRSAVGQAGFDFFTRSTGNVANYTLRLASTANENSVFRHDGVGSLLLVTNRVTPIKFKTFDKDRMIINGGGTVNILGSATVNGGVNVTSDKRVKKNIEDFTLGLDAVKKMNPVKFDYTGVANTSTERVFVGLVAQELQKIAPDFVSDYQYIEEDSEGELIKEHNYLQIHGSELKYILINAVKDQSAIIEAQNERIVKLESLVEKLANNTNFGNSQSSIIVGDESKAILSQNTPNPLNDVTKIEYFLPKDVSSASIKVHNLNGKLIKEIKIANSGIGSIEFKVSKIPSGLYTYTLIADGVSIDTKKMIVE